jgi:hypothetical protein
LSFIEPENKHVIKPNHSTAYPTCLLFLDTETRTTPDGDFTRHDLLLAWTCYRRIRKSDTQKDDDWRYWENPQKLCEYIQSCVTSKRALHIYGHNIAFDLQVIQFYKWFPLWGWKLEFIYDTGLTYLLVIRNEDRTLKAISTTNYFSYSLDVLGRELGIPKLDVDFEKSSKADLSVYCKQDVLITVKAMERYIAFNKEHDTGKFSMTRASQSFSAFRHRFMDTEIRLHKEKPIQQLERSAYFGGRTECFRIGKVPGDDFTFLDVNSMYPFVMMQNLYPTKCLWYKENPDPSDWLPFLSGYAVIADVTLDTDDPVYAKRHEGKLIFPVGTFDTCVCTAGFRHAIGAKHLVKVNAIAVYEWAPVFRQYVDYFYPLKSRYKADGNEIYTATVKLFLNSLYGKFGQRISDDERFTIPDQELTCRVENYDKVTGDRWTDTIMFGTLIRSRGEIEGPNTFVAIPAHVTEYARFYLWSIIKAIGRDRVYYCDTDSLAISSELLSHGSIHLDGLALGALAVDKTGEGLEIWGLKDYQIGSDRKLKGIPLRAVELQENVYRYDQFLGAVSHQRLGEVDSFLTRSVTKRLKHDYNKGTVNADGSVSPYCFPLI